MKDAISYIRVSSEEQADSGLGLEAQRQRIAAYCAMKGLHLALPYGLVMSKFSAMATSWMPLLSKSSITLAASATERNSRSNLATTTTALPFFAAARSLLPDGRLARGLPALTPGSSNTSAMAQMASVFAELERAMIRERTRSAMSVKRSRGERISGHAPYGWDFGRGSLLVENAREQRVIARMRRMQAEGMSYRGIAVRLDEEGIRPKRGKRWIHATVKTILLRNAA